MQSINSTKTVQSQCVLGNGFQITSKTIFYKKNKVFKAALQKTSSPHMKMGVAKHVCKHVYVFRDHHSLLHPYITGVWETSVTVSSKSTRGNKGASINNGATPLACFND